MDPSPGPTWEQTIFVLGALTILVTAGIIVVWQAFATWRSRMSIAREEAYRKLAEEVAESQTKTAESMETATADLADLRRRMAEVERMLKEVG
jgi:type VI protein secretion system component VasK